MKIVEVTSTKGIKLTPTQAAIIMYLKNNSYMLTERFVLSLADLTSSQAATLIKNVNSEYDAYYAYGKTTTAFEITDAEHELVRCLYNLPTPLKVTAIKFIRQQYAIGLKEAKDLCDQIGQSQ